MPNRKLLIGSTEPYSGKTAAAVGLGRQLRQLGLDIAYGKPIGTCSSERLSACPDEDVRFIQQMLNLPDDRLYPTVVSLDAEAIQARLLDAAPLALESLLARYRNHDSAVPLLIEGPGTLEEGALFGLSLPTLADQIDAQVLLVARFQSVLVVDRLVAARQRLGDRLLGVIINDVPEDQLSLARSTLKDYLQAHQIPTLGILPSSPLMRSVSVGELIERLDAEVLCCPERTDALVENLSIGAMNVNSAMKYFRKAENIAVVTGGDRADLQLAALETSTQCLILTGHLPPRADILGRAKELEVPILSVDLDTLTTVSKIEKAFEQVRLQVPIKVQCFHLLMEKHFDLERLLAALSLQPSMAV